MRRRHAQNRRERSSCRYRLRSALGSTYVSSALVTIRLVERSSRHSRQRPGHPAEQALAVIESLHGRDSGLLVWLKYHDRLTPLGDDDLTLSLEELPDFRETGAQVANASLQHPCESYRIHMTAARGAALDPGRVLRQPGAHDPLGQARTREKRGCLGYDPIHGLPQRRCHRPRQPTRDTTAMPTKELEEITEKRIQAKTMVMLPEGWRVAMMRSRSVRYNDPATVAPYRPSFARRYSSRRFCTSFWSPRRMASCTPR